MNLKIIDFHNLLKMSKNISRKAWKQYAELAKCSILIGFCVLCVNPYI